MYGAVAHLRSMAIHVLIVLRPLATQSCSRFLKPRLSYFSANLLFETKNVVYIAVEKPVFFCRYTWVS